jgi:hypothetical protein
MSRLTYAERNLSPAEIASIKITALEAAHLALAGEPRDSAAADARILKVASEVERDMKAASVPGEFQDLKYRASLLSPPMAMTLNYRVVGDGLFRKYQLCPKEMLPLQKFDSGRPSARQAGQEAAVSLKFSGLPEVRDWIERREDQEGESYGLGKSPLPKQVERS